MPNSFRKDHAANLRSSVHLLTPLRRDTRLTVEWRENVEWLLQQCVEHEIIAKLPTDTLALPLAERSLAGERSLLRVGMGPAHPDFPFVAAQNFDSRLGDALLSCLESFLLALPTNAITTLVTNVSFSGCLVPNYYSAVFLRFSLAQPLALCLRQG